MRGGDPDDKEAGRRARENDEKERIGLPSERMRSESAEGSLNNE